VRALAALLIVLAACAAPERPMAKAANTELIAGEFERHPPDGETAVLFSKDGTFRLAKNRMQFDVEPAIATGTYALDGDKLTFTHQQGTCTGKGEAVGVYKVGISKIGIHFTKVTDTCERRGSLDGQTWWRIK
jgi:hypothetical protein